MNNTKRSGFTLVELMVVVTIIALLVGLILPAVNSARQAAMLNESKINVKQIHMGMKAYETKYGKLWTGTPEDLSEFNVNFLNPNAAPNPAFKAGRSAVQTLGIWWQAVSSHGWFDQSVGVNWGAGGEDYSWAWGGSGAADLILPYTWHSSHPGNTGGHTVQTPGSPFQAKDAGIGTWRFPNTYQCSTELGGPLSHIYFAPKDGATIDLLKKHDCWDNVQDMCNTIEDDLTWRGSAGVSGSVGAMRGVPSTYSFSPSAMVNPKVWQRGNWRDPMTFARGFRQPSMGMAKYGNLKTFLCEHPMLQNATFDCASPPVFEGTFMDPSDPDALNYNGCSPYLFNAHYESEPVVANFDGSTGTLSIMKAKQDNSYASGGTNAAQNGLFHNGSADGNLAYMLNHSFWTDHEGSAGVHTHEVDGIRGRSSLGN